jgi:hypothetical protein
MNASNTRVIHEPARAVPVRAEYDVLVVGGGPAGFAAAVAAAREGADVVLVERYGHLGGLSTGGLVFWIDRMTDWDGKLVVGGIGQEILDRSGSEATLGPPKALWGSRDEEAVAYWKIRVSAQKGIVVWSPTVDPEVMKCVYNDMVREAGIRVLMHCWAVAVVQEGLQVKGVIFESKQGRHALLAHTTVDCTGDGDILALAGADHESDFDSTSMHACLNTPFRFGNVDCERYLTFRLQQPEKWQEMLQRAGEEGIQVRDADPTSYDSVVYFHSPRFVGYSALKISDLTEVEFLSRDAARKGLAWYRANVPGFERAWLLDTAQQIGTRHARRLAGVERVTIGDWRSGRSYPDGIGLCPGPIPSFPTLEIPYNSLVPQRVEGLLVAGRNLSCDPKAHNPLREVPECWVMGQAAGVAATLALQHKVAPREVPIDVLKSKLLRQGAIL